MQMEDKGAIAELLISELMSGAAVSSSATWADLHHVDHLTLVGVLKSLEAKSFVLTKLKSSSKMVLTPKGEAVLEHGSPEFRLWQGSATPICREEVAELLKITPEEAKVIISSAIKLGLVSVIKETGLVQRKVETAQDVVRDQCQSLLQELVLDKKVVDSLKRHNLISVKTIKYYEMTLGPEIGNYGKKYETDLTEEMISNGSWRNLSFKRYNFDSLGIPIVGGYLHPLLKIRKEFREIFLQMGFEEMDTSRYVESSFWNFDALYQPQYHPTRDAHDTFFLKDPSYTESIPEDYMKRVKMIHEVGGFGSIGYRYKWLEEEARKNILRTHTTGVSAGLLYRLARQYESTNELAPGKYFSIDRVFRNEATDQTHLAEFHQCEGMIIGHDLTLAELIGVISTFFTRQGFSRLKFKPAYNPYTEPSMEVFAFHPELGKLVEIGNSGMFRPEMLQAMGFPSNLRVLAWGVSLERPAMIKYKLKDIRKLFGHEVSYNFIKDNPICLIEKFHPS